LVYAINGNLSILSADFKHPLQPEGYVLNGAGRNGRISVGRTVNNGGPGELRFGDTFEFVNVDSSLYESVDRRLLVIHSSIAELLHLTGAGQVIDRYLQDFENTQVLSEDGSSASYRWLCHNWFPPAKFALYFVYEVNQTTEILAGGWELINFSLWRYDIGVGL
jgi:hypothetical protein